jgi:hypothetical protein
MLQKCIPFSAVVFQVEVSRFLTVGFFLLGEMTEDPT